MPDRAGLLRSIRLDMGQVISAQPRRLYPNDRWPESRHHLVPEVSGRELQIEGALAYLDTVGTRADDQSYKRMRLKLVSAYRALHNDLHWRGHYHEHTPLTNHPERGQP